MYLNHSVRKDRVSSRAALSFLGGVLVVLASGCSSQGVAPGPTQSTGSNIHPLVVGYNGGGDGSGGHATPTPEPTPSTIGNFTVYGSMQSCYSSGSCFDLGIASELHRICPACTLVDLTCQVGDCAEVAIHPGLPKGSCNGSVEVGGN